MVVALHYGGSFGSSFNVGDEHTGAADQGSVVDWFWCAQDERTDEKGIGL
jgi:hypothetical protein